MIPLELPQSLSQYVLVDSSASTASGQLPINHDGRHTADAVLRRAGCHIVLMHVMNVNLVLWARQLPDLLNSVFASRATRAKNLDLVLHICTLFPAFLLVELSSAGRQARHETAVARRGHEFQTEARINRPTPTYVARPDSK